MSASESRLSSPSHGYGMVLALSQASMNRAMRNYLRGLPDPDIAICYVADAKGLPTPIAYADLLQKSKGTDPFAVPDRLLPDDPRFQNLLAARYMAGFKARMGIPPGLAPNAMPDILTLAGDTLAVGFTLVCEEFIVTQLTAESAYAHASWMKLAQSAEAPWLFKSSVGLRMAGVGRSAYDGLPQAVRDEIKNLGGQAFSVERLLFDLDKAALESMPAIAGAPSGAVLHGCLRTDFMDAYFQQMKTQAAPPLAYSIVPSSTPPYTLRPTDLGIEAGRGTLDYLCATHNKTLPPPVPFAWDWIGPGPEADSDGVVAINRNTLANYLKDQLLNPHAKPNCFAAWVRVNMDGLDVDYRWNLAPWQTPTITMPASGPTLLGMAYSSYAEDEFGLNGDTGRMALAPSYTLEVSCACNTITIVQHLVIWLRVQVMQAADSGNVVDIRYVDTYTLEAGPSGALSAVKSSTKTDNSTLPGSDGFLNFFTGIKALNDDIAAWLRQYGESSFDESALNVMRCFVFPGGQTFAFKDVRFSDHQDLVAHIVCPNPAARAERGAP